MMQPDRRLITIHDNEKLITEFISDMIITTRKSAHKWSGITNQTPNLKTGYPSQHLASLIEGADDSASFWKMITGTFTLSISRTTLQRLPLPKIYGLTDSRSICAIPSKFLSAR